MSDSDKKDAFTGLGDLDWDSALDEWEKQTFVPEVARDAETKRVAPSGKGEAAAPAPSERAPESTSEGSAESTSPS